MLSETQSVPLPVTLGAFTVPTAAIFYLFDIKGHNSYVKFSHVSIAGFRKSIYSILRPEIAIRSSGVQRTYLCELCVERWRSIK